MIKGLILLFGLVLTQTSSMADEHLGHSDDLLLLLKDKIALQTLLKQTAHGSTEHSTSRRLQQHELLQQALTRLKHYVAIPESQYPNMDMYHESLKSRASLMQEFADLMLQTHCTHEQTCKPD